jgi:hypothetical protein
MRTTAAAILLALALSGTTPALAHTSRGIGTRYRGHISSHRPEGSSVRVRLLISNRRDAEVSLRCVIRVIVSWTHLETEARRTFKARYRISATIPGNRTGRSQPLTFRVRHPEFVPEYEADPTNWVIEGWGLKFPHCHVRWRGVTWLWSLAVISL